MTGTGLSGLRLGDKLRVALSRLNSRCIIRAHQEKIHLLENGLKVLKMAF